MRALLTLFLLMLLAGSGWCSEHVKDPELEALFERLDHAETKAEQRRIRAEIREYLQAGKRESRKKNLSRLRDAYDDDDATRGRYGNGRGRH